MKDINQMTKKEFRNVPYLEDSKYKTAFDSIVVIPANLRNGLHDSGYRCLSFVLIKSGIPLGKISGCSDVIHVGGIGGQTNSHRHKSIYPKLNEILEHAAFSIDCLPKSGLLRIFCRPEELIHCGAYSSFEIIAVKCKEG